MAKPKDKSPSEEELLEELSKLSGTASRIQSRAKRLVEDTNEHNDRLRELIDAYRQADEALPHD